MLKELQELTVQTRILHIYPNNHVVLPESSDKAPQVKAGAKPTILEIHSLTAAQLNQINEMERSATPPLRLSQDGTPVLDDNKDPMYDYNDPSFLQRKNEMIIHARCLAIYHGCDAIRKDLVSQEKDHKHLATSLSQGLIETISAHIINAEIVAYRPDFFSQASSSDTQS